MTSSLFASLALAGAAAFFATATWAHLRRPELAPAQTSLSAYLTDGTRAVLIAGYAALIVAMLCLPVALLLAHGVAPACVVLFACFTLAAGALVPVVATSRASLALSDGRSMQAIQLHRHAAWLAVVATSLGMLFYAAAGVIDRPAALVPNAALVLAGLNGVLCIATLLARTSRYGPVQKGLIASIVLWIGGEALALLLA